MAAPVQIIGTYLSPYVRKVLVCLALKGIDYEIDPIVPFFGNDEFSRLSTLRRIPVLMDGPVTLCDSSVICQYLEDRYPAPALYPKDIADRAHARWWEEFADTRLGDVFIWRFYNVRVIQRFVFGASVDEEKLARTLNEEIPGVMNHLEAHAPGAGFLFGDLSIADISLAAFFRNAAFAGFSPDPARWPNTAAYIGRVLSQPGFVQLTQFEDLLMRTPIPQHRAVLKEKGAPISEKTWAAEKPRPGVMPI